jgi:hypothetical protein
VVVELHSESHGANPTTRAWAITRRAQRAHHRHLDREQRGDRRHAERSNRADRISRPHQLKERAVPADTR